MAKNNNLGDFIKGIADKLRSFLNTDELINPQDFEDKITEVNSVSYERGYSDGGYIGYQQAKHEAYDTFWDTFQKNGNRTEYEYAFAWGGWTNEIFMPKYDITVELRNSGNMFAYSGITGSLKTILNNNGVTLTFSNASGGSYGARYIFVGTKFTELPVIDVSQAKGNQAMQSLFSLSTLVQSIEQLVLPDNCTGYGTETFNRCYALENIDFGGTIKYSLSFEHCPLSGQSVYNIFNILDEGSYTGTRTLSFNSVAKNNFIDVAGEDTWNGIVSYYSLKNWTFSVV